MNSKVKELVEWAKKIIDAPNNLEGSDEGYDEWVERVAKQILSHPDLALIDRGKSPPAVYDYIHYQHGEWCFTPKRLSEFIDAKEEYRQSVIPLAEALKEVKDEVER